MGKEILRLRKTFRDQNVRSEMTLEGLET